MILHRRLAFGRIARTAARRSETLLTTWLPDATLQGDGWCATNPHSSRPTTLTIERSGGWDDPATGARGRDLIDLAAFVHHLPRPDAALLVARMIGTHPYD